MAIHPFGEDESRGCQSANSYRSRIEMAEAERFLRDGASELNKGVHAMVDPATELLIEEFEREMRLSGPNADILDEIKKSKNIYDQVANIAVGVALIVASTAAEASYNKAVLDAQSDADKQYQNEMTRSTREYADGETQTLSQYMQCVEETRNNIEATKQAYYVEYKDTREDAQRIIDGAKNAIESAKHDYDKEKMALKREEDYSDATYKKELDAANQNIAKVKTELEAAKTVRDTNERLSVDARNAAVQTAQTQYNADVKRIASEFSGSNKDIELQKAAERRDQMVSHAQSVHDSNAQKYSAIYNTQAESAQKQIEATQRRIETISQKHTAEIQSINERSNSVETRHQTVVNRQNEIIKQQNDIIKDSQKKYSEAVKDAKRENTMAQTKLDQYQAKIQERAHTFSKAHIVQAEKFVLNGGGKPEEIAIIRRVSDDRAAAAQAAKFGSSNYVPVATKEDYKMAEQIAVRYAGAAATAKAEVGKYNVQLTGGSLGTAVGFATGRGAEEFANSIISAHIELGKELAIKFGDSREANIVNKVLADIKAEADAKKNGTTYNPLATEAERKQADQIIQKYAGSINSEGGVKQALQQYKKAEKDLAKEIGVLQSKIGSKNDEINTLNSKIVALQKTVDQMAADKKALNTGKTIDGVKLTAEQRKEILARVQKNGNIADNMKALTNLKTQKNAAAADLNKLAEKLESNKTLSNKLRGHAVFLKKNGKVVVNVTKGKEITLGGIFNRGLTRGGSKKNAAAQAAGIGMIVKSVQNLSSSINSNLYQGNSIHEEISKSIKTLDKVANKYDSALEVGRYVSMFAVKALTLPAGSMLMSGEKMVRILGENSRLGGLLSRKLATMGNLSNNKFSKALVGGGRVLGGFGGTLLKAPSVILHAPMKLKKMPRKMAEKALTSTANGVFRLTRKTAGVVVGGSAYLASKAVKKGASAAGRKIRTVASNTIGQTKLYRNAAARLSLLKDRVASAAKNISDKFDPLRTFKDKLSGAFAFVGMLISTVLSFLVSIAIFLLGSVVLLMLIIAVIAFLISMIYSAFGAIVSWFETTTTAYQALIKNNPQFIVNQAVNYRNSELEIFELFNRAHSDKTLIRVNDSPIYYALYDNDFHWFGWTGEEKLESTNVGALNKYKALADSLDFYAYNTDAFKTQAEYYDSIKLSYYSADQLATDSDGNYIIEKRGDIEQYKLKEKPTASKYEISNAKDALAIVDTLYTVKQDTMQRIEVLSYLGVGDYQVAHSDTKVITDNLFWASHKFIYESGNLGSDIWYHVTDWNGYNKGTVIRNKKYNANGTNWEHIPYSGCEPIEVTFSYVGPGARTQRHKSLSNFSFNNGAYGEYTLKSNAVSKEPISWRMNGGMTATELYYYSECKTRHQLELSNGRGTELNLYTYEVNIDDKAFISRYHRNSGCNKLKFYCTDTDGQYYVVDSNGRYMGDIYIRSYGTYKNVYQAMRDVEIQGNLYTTNFTNGNALQLQYFELTWSNIDNCYKFKVASANPITESTTHADGNKYLNSPIKEQRSNTTGKLLTSGYAFDSEYPKLNKSKIKINCDHWDEGEGEIVRATFEVCPGHIDLDVKMVVSLMDDEDRLFKEAMKVQGIEKDQPGDSILGLFTINLEEDIVGFGTYTQKAYNPEADWAEDGGNREIAKAKMEAEIQYVVPDGKDANELSIDIRHKWSTEKDKDGKEKEDLKTFKSLASSSDGVLLYGMAFNGQVYYTESFVSGEQRNLVVYLKDPSTGLVGPKSLTFSINSGNRPIVSVESVR